MCSLSERDKMDVAVDATEKSEVGIQRRDIGIERIVHLHGNDVVGARR